MDDSDLLNEGDQHVAACGVEVESDEEASPVEFVEMLSALRLVIDHLVNSSEDNSDPKAYALSL